VSSTLYDRVSSTRAYDLLMRLPLAGWHLWLAYHVAATIIAAAASPDLAYPALQFVAQGATFLFFISIAVLTLIRRSPVVRGSGLHVRVVALGGALCFGLIAFLPVRALPPAGLVLSITLIALGSALSAYAVWHLGRSLSIMPEARRLVTSGPYRIVRHPLYLCEFVTMTGVMLQYLSLAAVLLLAMQAGFQFLRLLNEERVLRGSFPEYRYYAERTARLIPGLY
jgi:protein-S-isoprenylcysteine O-methyltransferase Ste14